MTARAITISDQSEADNVIKKILLTIVAVLVAGAALSIYGMYTAMNNVVKTNETQLREYVQMDDAAQDKYVLEHADELLE